MVTIELMEGGRDSEEEGWRGITGQDVQSCALVDRNV